jgi:probable FeS assembly SUF system protein SufT
MNPHEPIALTRDCEAIQVPSGTRIVLPTGTTVMITQALGDTYTVTTQHGAMVRISGRDADALGLAATTRDEPEPATVASVEDVEKLVWEQLKTCYDPEIPVNIVDLGLVYHCTVRPLPEGGHRVEVKMTLTAPGCGMGSAIAADAEAKIARLPTVEQASVEVVFEPPWNPNMMSEAARLELGMM